MTPRLVQLLLIMAFVCGLLPLFSVGGCDPGVYQSRPAHNTMPTIMQLTVGSGVVTSGSVVKIEDASKRLFRSGETVQIQFLVQGALGSEVKIIALPNNNVEKRITIYRAIQSEHEYGGGKLHTAYITVTVDEPVEYTINAMVDVFVKSETIVFRP